MNPLVSIIVPCYNVEKYLDKCVESITYQTYTNLEIFLVDDGSKDLTPKICDKWAANDPRIKVIHKQNGGLSDARNVAIEKVKGRYIVFVDSDDYIANNHIYSLYKMIIEYSADISIQNCQPYLENTTQITNNDVPYSVNCVNSEVALEIMFYQKQYDNSAWAKMYKTELFENIRYPYGLLYEDLPTTYKIILKANKVVYSNYRSYFYLLRENSIEGSAFSYNKYKSCIFILNQLENDRCLFTDKVKIALNARLLSFLFHVLIIVPNSDADTQHKFLELISNYRLSVLFNNKARIKNRIAALLSFGGLPAINLFKRIGSYRNRI